MVSIAINSGERRAGGESERGHKVESEGFSVSPPTNMNYMSFFEAVQWILPLISLKLAKLPLPSSSSSTYYILVL